MARVGAGDMVTRGPGAGPLGHWPKVEGGPTSNAITGAPFAAPTFSDPSVEVTPLNA